jgi:hypothetical protein
MLNEGQRPADVAENFLHPDIEWVEPSLPGKPPRIVHGRDAVVSEVWGTLGDGFSEVRIEPEEFVAQDETVIVIGAFRGTALDAESFAISFVHIWRFRDGKVVYMRTIADTAAFMASQGLLKFPTE